MRPMTSRGTGAADLAREPFEAAREAMPRLVERVGELGGPLGDERRPGEGQEVLAHRQRDGRFGRVAPPEVGQRGRRAMSWKKAAVRTFSSNQ